MRAFLQKYDINLDSLQSLMLAKMVQIVKNAAVEGRITQDEANSIYSHMSDGPRAPKGKGSRSD